MGSLLRTAAVSAAGFVALSFLLFVTDQSRQGSATQVGAIDGSQRQVAVPASIDAPAPEPSVERGREARHSAVREAIDDVNDRLVAPFTGVAGSDNVWVGRMLTGGLALLVYGLGGTMLANFLPRSRRRHGDWREATG